MFHQQDSELPGNGKSLLQHVGISHVQIAGPAWGGLHIPISHPEFYAEDYPYETLVTQLCP